MTYRKKLIEVALPLEEINIASAREKSIRHGHPSTLHLWWARRPLATCRAVLFSSIIDDPGEDGVPEELLDEIDNLPLHHKYRHLADEEPLGANGETLTNEEAARQKLARQRRYRLFTFIERLVQWENSNDPDTLEVARGLIRAACRPACPPDTNDIEVVMEEALKFNGYERYGDSCAEAANTVRKKFEETGAWQGPIDDLRNCLFFMQRDCRWQGNPITEYEKRVFFSLYGEINRRWSEVASEPPPVLDPFCGGGSIPLEAQRLGLEAHGSDLNPVAVLITKAMIEIPPKFAGQPPVNPIAQANLGLSQPKPPETDDFELINEFGHTFDVKAAFNGKDAVDLQEMAQSIAESWTEIGVWQGTSDELRGTMLYFLREQRHWGSAPTRGTDRYLLFITLHQAIRAAWIRGSSAHAAPSLPMNVTFKGAKGLAEDVRYYGQWMRDEAEQRIGHLYPKVRVTEEMARDRSDLKPLIGSELTVIAWLWARTAKCPNPACGADAPLVRSYALSTKKGQEAWLEVQPQKDGKAGVIYGVRQGTPRSVQLREIESGTCVVTDTDAKGKPLKKLKKVKATFLCPSCRQGVLKGDSIDDQANSTGLGIQPLAIVSEGKRGRHYLRITNDQIDAAQASRDMLNALPSGALPTEPCRGTFASNAQGRIYGFKQFKDYFTDRQLVALTTFSDLVGEARQRVRADALAAGLDETQSTDYSNAISTYLAFAVDKMADRGSTICSWDSSRSSTRNTFARQAIPMTWDFAEANPVGDSTGSWDGAVESTVRILQCHLPQAHGQVVQADATKPTNTPLVFSTDPPYFDNIGYADLSDFFYVWLRRSLRDVYPELFLTVVTPKTDELIATPYRHDGSKEKATMFFESGLRQVFARIRDQGLSDYPTTIYYAFKQSETEEADGEDEGSATASTGWETMLQGLVDTGFAINGTWPMRTELANKITMGNNMLASCIVLACRQRGIDAQSIHRRQFLSLLRQELKPALIKLTQGNVAPVDLAQAAIGPGMAVFSRYTAVLEADGSPMRVRTALTLINQALDEALEEQEGWYDQQTRWAVTWFSQRGFQEGPYGEAETLATAKDAPVNTMVEAGIVKAGQGRVKLLSREELPAEYDPQNDPRTTVWEATQYLVRELESSGELGAARMMRRFRETKPDLDVDRARELAYRLYAICDGKRWTNEARGYNALVLSWSDIEAVSQTDDALWSASDSVGTGTGAKRNETPSFEGMND